MKCLGVSMRKRIRKCARDVDNPSRQQISVGTRLSIVVSCKMQRLLRIAAEERYRFRPFRREQEAKGNAAKRGLEWTLTREQFLFFWQNRARTAVIQFRRLAWIESTTTKGYTFIM